MPDERNRPSAVELDRQFCQLPWRKCCAGGIVRAAVDTVFAVIDAVVGHQHLEQRNASPIGSKAVADSTCDTGADPTFDTGPIDTTGGAGNIVFCRGGKYLEFFHYVHIQPSKKEH